MPNLFSSNFIFIYIYIYIFNWRFLHVSVSFTFPFPITFKICRFHVSDRIVSGYSYPFRCFLAFSTLIKGFCMMGNNTAAMQLLRKMEERGCQPEPNVVAYSTIIHSLLKDTLYVDAMKLFSEMISRGIVADVVTYNSLIHGVCNVGQWKLKKLQCC
ncbi:putative pentatricopeptide [Rosa chinensis]|uniref:Putative pentatricopeptide n=1 Tax=Rosa chinensis TaxID=74649 RepID=A0A2P6QMB7_ROSCH|nr:putative pentatricopeptide [Rosa chinensis]